MALGGYAEAYIGLINGVLCVFTRPGPQAEFLIIKIIKKRKLFEIV